MSEKSSAHTDIICIINGEKIDIVPHSFVNDVKPDEFEISIYPIHNWVDVVNKWKYVPVEIYRDYGDEVKGIIGRVCTLVHAEETSCIGLKGFEPPIKCKFLKVTRG